jgi:hypothetical protein
VCTIGFWIGIGKILDTGQDCYIDYEWRWEEYDAI